MVVFLLSVVMPPISFLTAEAAENAELFCFLCALGVLRGRTGPATPKRETI